jgi:hypothetical protein
MKLKFFTILMLLLLTACSRENLGISAKSGSLSEADFEVQCLNGVQYYVRTVAYKGYMAVKINKDTLKPETCNQ